MKLAELLKPWLKGCSLDIEVHGLKNDSRQIKAGDAFFAYPGASCDGRLFIPQALRAGAVAVVYDPGYANVIPKYLLLERTCVPLPLLQEKLGAIASRFYAYPGDHLKITGVTGTNGKTTIAFLLAQAHRLLNQPSAYIGTLGEGQVFDLNVLNNTTPDALALQTLLHQYHQQNVQQVCMEVSSHALDQGRVQGIPFKQAIFTNLTRDHLDYHKTLAAYREAKARLFAQTSLEWAILNQDDPASQHMHANVPKSCQVLWYGTQDSATVRATQWEFGLRQTTFQVHSPWGEQTIELPLTGAFNLYNALAVYSSLLAYDYPPADIKAAIKRLKAAPGRMEMVLESPMVMVDYAHTPDALENVLLTLNELKKGRLIVVFGCGGDRDAGKRPLMGRIAARHADITIVTSDNPRHENPETIIADIMTGIPSAAICYKITDRYEAIAKALSLAEPQDVVLVAGKGHEDYQQIGSHRQTFSDQAVISEIAGVLH